MKSTTLLLALTVAFACCVPSMASADEPISTTIQDALPVAAWLDDVMSGEKPFPWESRVMPAGYWTVFARTYCLHAGKSGPVHGSGYVMATAKGTRAALILRLLAASLTHFEMAQNDIQEVIWAVEAETPLEEFPPALKAAANTLLDAKDLDSLRQAGVAGHGKGMFSRIEQQLQLRIPGSDKVTEAMDLATHLRSLLTDPTATYEQIEAVAVPARAVPLVPMPSEPMVTTIAHGNWTSAGRRFYMRALPRDYRQTDLEFVKVKIHDVRRDPFNRITHWSGAFGSVDVIYRNQAASPVSPFQQVVFHGNQSGQTLTVRASGFVIDSVPAALGRDVGCAPADAECLRRSVWLQTFYADVSSYRKANGLRPADGSLIAYHPRLDFALAVADLLSDKDAALWVQALRASLRSEEAGVGCLLSADCPAPRLAAALTTHSMWSLAAAGLAVIPAAQAQGSGPGIPWCAENCYTSSEQPELPPDCEPLNPPGGGGFASPTDPTGQRLGLGGWHPSVGKLWNEINSLLGGKNDFNCETDNWVSGVRS